MALESLRLDEFSDREFLLVMIDLADADGWVESDRVQAQLDLAKRAIASTRLSWLQRYGAVEREHERDAAGNLRYTRGGQIRWTQRWRLTDIGEQMALGQLRKRESDALEKVGDAQMLLVTRWLATRQRVADPTVSKLISREYRYSTSSLRNGATA